MMNRFLLLMIGLCFNSFIFSQVFIDSIGLSKYLIAEKNFSEDHSLILFGEQHGRSENENIEFLLLKELKNNLYTHHLIEADPLESLWIRYAVVDSSLKFNTETDGTDYVSVLRRIYRNADIKSSEKIFGIAPIRDIKNGLFCLEFYLRRNVHNKDLISLVRACKGVFLRKKIKHLISYYFENKNKFNDESLHYAIISLNNYIVHGNDRRDFLMYINYKSFIDNFKSTRSFAFLGKLHVANSQFKIGREMNNSFSYLLRQDKDSNVHLTTGIVSYVNAHKQRNDFTLDEFRLSHYLPCDFVVGGSNENKCVDFVYISKP